MSTNNIEWFFPSTGGGMIDGFKDAGIQYFEGNHPYWLARETIQNSIDARLDTSKPVEVHFEIKSAKVEEIFPDFAAFRDFLSRCMKTPSGAEESEFFKKAYETTGEIPVLVISDYNTKGLIGNEEEDDDGEKEVSKWFRCVKSRGSNQPSGPSGGTFGIGKHAVFPASGLRTAFYFSVIGDGKEVFIGKSILKTFTDTDGDKRQGTGFYCLHEQNNGRHKVLGIRDNPANKFFKRKKRGTSIFIVGYKHESHWEESLVKSVLQNYYVAIEREQLVVKFRENESDHVVIDKGSLRRKLEDYKSPALPYYLALTEPENGKPFEEILSEGLGKCMLFVKKGLDSKQYTKHVVYMRQPLMEVERRKKIVLRDNYVAIFLCENNEGNDLLKVLEPPTHNEWDPARSPKGAKLLTAIDIWVRKSLKSLNITGDEEFVDPEVDEYLPLDTEHTGAVGGVPAAKGAGAPVGGALVSATRENTELLPYGGKPTQLPGLPQAKRKKSLVPRPSAGFIDIDFRWLPDPGVSATEGELVVVANESFTGKLTFRAAGDQGKEDIPLYSAADVSSGAILTVAGSDIAGISMASGDRRRFRIRLNRNARLAAEIEARR